MSGSYNVDGDILAQGINCVVRVTDDETGVSGLKEIGFVQDFSIRKSINIQRAECLGEILPVSLDPTSIQTSITMKGFIPSARLLADTTKESVRGQNKAFSAKAFNPDDSQLVETALATKIAYIDFYDKRGDGAVIGFANWAIVTQYSDSSSGKGYVMADVTMEAIGYNNGPSYESVT
ncbi:MAG: hypothetical protein LBB72_01480 [Spirochaetaceae bacterium]|jgi:hypothetical protein|nr:hypothetical protein [Spirochaetaceae bacterium]